MLKRLLALVVGAPPPPPIPRQQAPLPPPRRAVPPGVPVYPPVDQGIIVADPLDIVETQADLIRRIRLLAGTQDADFEIRFLSVIRRLATYIQLLPASESDTHHGPGGLFRLCLELGFFAAQAAEAVVFAGRSGSEDRRREEPRWRYAAFLAGLNCELHRAVTHMTVVDVEGRVWPAFNEPITDWLNAGKSDRYFVRWTEGVSSAATTGLLINRITASDNLQYLQDGSPRIVPTLMDTIAGVRGHEKSALADLVDRIREKVVHRDKAVSPTNYGKLTVGSHLEPHLLDAMRQLVSTGKWTINEHKSRLWYAKNGLFLIWRLGAKEMLEVLSKASVSGIPQDTQTLLEILLTAKVFTADKDGSPYWMIMPPGSTTELVAVKLATPMTLFGTMLDEIKPLDELAGQQPAGPALAPATAPAPKAPAPSAAAAGAAPPTKPATAAASPPAASEPAAASESPPPAEPSVQTPPPLVQTHAPGGSIPEVSEAKQNATMPAAVAGTLRPAPRDVMNSLLNEHLTRKARDQMGVTEHGFAVSIEHLASFGITLDDLIKNLQEAGWLYSPPEKPNKKVHQVVLNNRKLDVIIIKQSHARDAGFIKE